MALFPGNRPARRLARLAPVLLAAALLAGCFRLPGRPAPSPTAAPTATPAPEVTLFTQGSWLYPLPVIDNHPKAPAVNQALHDYFTPILEALRQASRTGPSLHPQYRLLRDRDDLLLLTSLTSGEGRDLDLPPIVIGDDGALGLPEPSPLAWLSDGEFLGAAQGLKNRGVAVSLEKYGQTASSLDMYAMLVDCYERLAGRAINADNIADNVTDETARKALALDLANYYEDYPQLDDYDVGLDTLSFTLATWITQVERDLYLAYSQPATVADALASLDFFLSLCMPGLGSYTDTAGSSPADRQAMLHYRLDITTDGRIPVALVSDPGRQLTRADLAALFVPLYESVMGTIDTDALYTPTYDDTRDEAVRKATGTWLMNTYPSAATFSPDLMVRRYQLPALASQCVTQLYLDWCGSQPGFIQRPLTYGQMVIFLDRLMASYDGRTRVTAPRIEVINDRDYDYYIDQYTTGEFGPVNCMPTTLVMALRWQSRDFPLTVEQIRSQFPDTTGGWYQWQVMAILDKYHATYSEKSVSLDNFIADLDRGRAIFCQIHEHDLAYSGHVLLIYGYIRQGDNLWFVAQDASGNTLNKYGEPWGKARVLEGNYVEFITSRFTGTYLSLAPVDTLVIPED